MSAANLVLGAVVLGGGIALAKRYLAKRDEEAPVPTDDVYEGGGGGPGTDLARRRPDTSRFIPGSEAPRRLGLSDLQAKTLTLPQLRTAVEAINRYGTEARAAAANVSEAEKLRFAAEQSRARGDLELARAQEEAAKIYEAKAENADAAREGVGSELEEMSRGAQACIDNPLSKECLANKETLFGPAEGADVRELEEGEDAPEVPYTVVALSTMVSQHMRGGPYLPGFAWPVQQGAGLPLTDRYDPPTAGVVRYYFPDAPGPLLAHTEERFLFFDPQAPVMLDGAFYPGYFDDNADQARALAEVAANMVEHDAGFRTDPDKLRLVTEFQEFAFLPAHGFWDPLTADAARHFLGDGAPEAVHEVGPVPWLPRALRGA